ncbi:MAG: enoyl-CoA hydratase/isomerase family protein [Acidobacteria bacterium]|nr:enoyl-CoA hydratase/isomerase family protein [Acidobacteriota bacterium]
MPDDRILVAANGPVATLVFNNPERRNAVSLEMWLEVAEQLGRLAAVPEVRALVVSGAGGRAFVSGADISRFDDERSSPQGVDRYNEASSAAYAALEAFPRPTIAKITGGCVGGGVNLAVCCDLRVCDDSARFCVPAAKLGLGYGYEPVRRLAAIVGVSNATDLLLTARLIDAAEALRIGLVHRVVAAAELDAVVDDLAASVAANAPLTVAALKAICKAVADPGAPADRGRLDALVAACFESDDYGEGRRAFLEKRPADFNGR